MTTMSTTMMLNQSDATLLDVSGPSFVPITRNNTSRPSKSWAAAANRNTQSNPIHPSTKFSNNAMQNTSSKDTCIEPSATYIHSYNASLLWSLLLTYLFTKEETKSSFNFVTWVWIRLDFEWMSFQKRERGPLFMGTCCMYVRWLIKTSWLLVSSLICTYFVIVEGVTYGEKMGEGGKVTGRHFDDKVESLDDNGDQVRSSSSFSVINPRQVVIMMPALFS